MNRFERLTLVVCAALCLLTGCAAKRQYEPIERVCVANADRADVMKIAELVLSKMRFDIEKSDTKTGYIRTRPLRAAQLFEFWHSDNVGSFNRAEANLHTIRKIVQLYITEQAGKLCVDCSVETERLSLPERRVRDSARAYSRFLESGESIQRLKLTARGRGVKAQRGVCWLEMGEDAQLETEILRHIENKISRVQKKKL